jgi:hypothetical protein
MPAWRSLANFNAAYQSLSEISRNITNGSLDLGRRHYAQSVAIALFEGICCGHPSITIAEFGVFTGDGLLSLCKAASFFREEFDYDIRVLGFDNGTGLPAPVDYRDHPEMWSKGGFNVGINLDPLRQKLPDFATLIIGDVGDRVSDAHRAFTDAPLAFAAIDVDYYSSTKRLMPVFEFEPACYLPGTPLYFDDVRQALLWNSWCGEELAIKEFNEEHAMRKIELKESFKIPRLYVLHVLDHPLRTGEQPHRPNFPLAIVPMF